jgi:hypothetical protein
VRTGELLPLLGGRLDHRAAAADRNLLVGEVTVGKTSACGWRLPRLCLSAISGFLSVNYATSALLRTGSLLTDGRAARIQRTIVRGLRPRASPRSVISIVPFEHLAERAGKVEVVVGAWIARAVASAPERQVAG